MLLGSHDYGEFGGGNCAHCGADCRYEQSFVCDDGTTRRAARGCIQLFPQSNLIRRQRKHLAAVEQKRIKGWNLASWDVAREDAFVDLALGKIDAATCEARLDDADRAARTYAARKFSGRR